MEVERAVGRDTRAMCLHVAVDHHSRFQLENLTAVLKIGLPYALWIAKSEFETFQQDFPTQPFHPP